MSIDVVVGPLSDSEWRRLGRFVEGARSGQRAQGKENDPLRVVAEAVVSGDASELPGNAWGIPVEEGEELERLRGALFAARAPHSIIIPDPGSGLAEHIAWHMHGNDEHEFACLRTAGGRVAMTADVWGRLAVLSRDEELRPRLNDYFFFAGHGDGADFAVGVDPDVPEEERWCPDGPVLLADEWAEIARVWGDIDLRDRVNALFEDDERAYLGEGDEDGEDEDGEDGAEPGEVEGELVEE